MNVISSISKLRAQLASERHSGKTIGFVPTMGALHDGHLALIKTCRRENDIVVVSIFVNPAQFGPGEDYRAYPRKKHEDVKLARQAGCDIIFYPSARTMYPEKTLTLIDVPLVSEGLCGARRPGHFKGVATVVAKLFHIVMPDTAYFGKKDYQQVAVICKMVSDLNIPVRIRSLETVREPDGLAMSSRNRYLNARQRQEAPVIYAALRMAKHQIQQGERSPAAIRSLIRKRITATSGRIDYIACVDAKTLQPTKRFQGKCLIAIAVFFGKARLIDNIVLQI